MRFGVVRPCEWIINGVCWCDDMQVLFPFMKTGIEWLKSGGADEVDLFGLWAFESILITVCRRWERWKSNLLLASTRDASDLRAEANRKMKPLMIKWCPLLVTNQTHTGGRGEKTLPVTSTTGTSKSVPVIQSRPNFFLLTQEIHSLQRGLSHYECWKSSRLEQ